MINYRYLLPEQVEETYKRIEAFQPDNRRNIQEFLRTYLSKDSAFFEVGDYQGVFWLSEIIPGWKANVHIVLWDEGAKHRSVDAKLILQRMMYLFRLNHVFAYIPALPNYEPALKYVEKIGFTYHALLPSLDQYEGQRVDMHILSFAKE